MDRIGVALMRALDRADSAWYALQLPARAALIPLLLLGLVLLLLSWLLLA